MNDSYMSQTSPSLHSTLSRTWPPLLLYATVWTSLLLVTVATASSLAQLAYASVVSPSPSSSSSCGAGFVRVPLDVPPERICLPVHMMGRSDWDFVVPVVFAGLLVSTSAFMIRSLGFWETENYD